MFIKIFKIWIVLLISITLFACATTGKHKYQNLFEEDIAQNRESIQNGSATKAIGELSMLLEMDPKNVDALFLRGLAYQKLGHFNKAIRDYNSLISINKAHSKAEYNLGMIYAFQLYKRDLALKHLDNFLTLEPKHPNSFSVAKIMKKFDSKANIDINSNPSLQKTINEIITDREIARATDENDIKKKKKTLEEAINANPDSANALFSLGLLYENEDKNIEAIKHYKKALEIKPTLGECHMRLGVLLSKNNQKQEAEIHFIKASLFKPGN